MRNLKRALSLTLASVMLLGMMVLGTSAASYPDVTDEHNVEAIEVLQAVGVMSGSNSGNFNPDSQVTRIEMAIVMSNLLNLKVDYFEDQCKFTDVPAWAGKYVAACEANGIVSGIGNNQFGTGNVTATQAALMMMKALGYFQYASDFGDDWARATAKLAADLSLFAGMDVGNNTALTRNQVAQLALNTLEATMVTAKDNTLHITTGENAGNISITGGKVDYIVRVAENNKIGNAIKTISAEGSSGSQLHGTTLELGENLYNGDLKKTENDIDDFGRPSTTWDYKNDNIGTYVNKDERIAVYTGKVSKGNIYSILSSTVRADVTATKNPASFDVYVDGVKGDPDLVASASNPAAYWERNSSVAIYTMDKGDTTDHNTSRNGTLTEVFVDADNNVTIAITNTYVFQATNDYSSSRNEVRVTPVGDTSTHMSLSSLTLLGEDFDITDIKADDYLLVTAAMQGTTYNSGALYDAKSVKVAEKVTGTVDSYKTKDSVVIDGQTYKYAAICWDQNGQTSDKGSTYTVGQEAIVVLDAYGNIIAVDEARSSSSFVYVNKFGSSNSTLDTKAMASVYFIDGTTNNVNVKQVVVGSNTYKTLSTMSAQGTGWYNFSVDSDGEYTLYAPSTTKYTAASASTGTDANEYTLMKSGQIRFLYDNVKTADVTSVNSVGAALANDKTIVIVRDKYGDVQAYTGTKAIPDVKVTPNQSPSPAAVTVKYLKTIKGNYVEFAFVDLYGTNGDVVGGDESASFLFLLRRLNQETGSNTFYNYEAINEDGTGAETVKFSTDSWSSGTTKAQNIGMLYYKARSNTNGEITNIVEVENTGRYFNNKSVTGIVTYDNGTLNIGGNAYPVNGSSKIVVVNTVKAVGNWEGDNWKISSVDGRGLAGMLTGWTLTNASIAGATVSTSDKAISEMYVYIGSVVETENAGSASITGVTVNGDAVPAAKILASDATVNHTVSINGDALAGQKVLGKISAAGEGNIAYAIKKNGEASYTAINSTTDPSFTSRDADVTKYDVIQITATPVIGGTPVVRYVVIEFTKTNVDPGTVVKGGTDRSSMITAGMTNSDGDSLIKGFNDGAYVFDKPDELKEKIKSDIRGGLKENMFFKFSTEEGKTTGTAMAVLVITNKATGEKVYEEPSSSYDLTAAAGGHYFYVQLVSANGIVINAGEGWLATKALTPGTYTWEISGSYVETVGGEFVIE